MKRLFIFLIVIASIAKQSQAQSHKINYIRYSSGTLRTSNLSSVMSATCPTSPITLAGYDTLGNTIANGQMLNTNAAPFYIFPIATAGSGIPSPCINTLYTDCYTNISTSGSETFLEGGVPVFTLCPTCSEQIDMGTGISGIPWGWALYDLNPSQQHQFVFCRDASITTSTVTLTDCWTGAALASNPSSILFSNATTTVGGTCDTLTLPANTDIGTSTYSIAPTTGIVGFGGYNDGATLIYPDSLAVGTYTVTYNFTPPASSGCGSVSGTFTFTIAHSLTVTVNSSAICIGQQTATLTASGATNYTWTPVTGLSSTTGSAVTANPSSTINYTVTGTSSDSMGVAIAIVTVMPLPPVSVSSASICVGGTATLTASGASSYTWSIGATTDTIIVSPTITTTYSVSGTIGTCSSTATSTVIVNTVPTMTVTASSVAICSGSKDTITASGATTYTWAPTSSLSDSTIANPIASPTTTTVYTVTGANACGISSPQTVTVTTNPLPAITINLSNNNVCAGQQSVTLTATGALSYTWYPSDSLNYDTGSTFIFMPYSTETFTLLGTATNGCVNWTDAVVNVYAMPVDSFILLQDTVPHTWDAYAFFSSNVETAIWYWGDGDSTVALYPSHTYSAAAYYHICVTATDTAGCSMTYCSNDSLYRLANNSPYSSMVYVNVKSNATGISQISSLNTNVSIYPNPNNGTFIIEPQNTLYNVHCTVYDVNGKAVLSQTINGKTTIDASSLNEGVYNISLQSNGGLVNKRVVIVR